MFPIVTKSSRFRLSEMMVLFTNQEIMESKNPVLKGLVVLYDMPMKPQRDKATMFSLIIYGELTIIGVIPYHNRILD